jgi:SPP1 family predicted phage head-tail adaptor
MGIGNYKHRVTFRSYDSIDDGYGGTIDTPVDILSTWAEKDPLRSSRRLSEAQVNLQKTTIFNIRWREGFTPDSKMKVIHRGLEYQIQGIVEDRDNGDRFWQITATDQRVAEEIPTT